MARKKLLNNMDADLQFEGCEVSDFHRTIWNAGKKVTEDATMQWLQDAEGDPGYQVMTEREVAEEVMACYKMDEESNNDEEEGPPICKIKLSELRSHLNDLITFIPSSSDPEVQPYYSSLLSFQREYYS
jgi:hypothetical protein